MDEGGFEAPIDLGPEIVDIYVDQVCAAVIIDAPDGLGDLSPGQHPVFVDNEQFEEGEFLGGEEDVFAGAANGLLVTVDFEVGDAVGDSGGDEKAASAQGLYTGEQLFEMKRFDEVVVSAGFEAGHFVFGGAEGSEHEDGEVGLVGADAAAEFEAADPGEDDVEDNEVVFVLQREFFAEKAVVGQFDMVELFLKAFPDEVGYLGFVFDE
jgi:hypothetical protein